MYIPKWFKEDNVEVLQAEVNRISFGTIITTGPAGIMASRVPMLIDPSKGRLGTLFGHMARGNPQWRESSAGEGLATFMGPDAYVTPNWYPTKEEDGKTVPTWNYIEVQVRGPVSFFEDPKRLLEVVTDLTDHHESGSEKPWSVSDAPADYISRELRSIVGFEMPVSTIEGKWKLSQNRVKEDREGVRLGLVKRNRPEDASVSREMQAREPRA
ncbi:MAG: FMN-binding negative transcriptional regulator [Nitrososphaerota archaeon]|nr:FMN-binding negative transcriptional regulator [Nitrososphaerota archaeon]